MKKRMILGLLGLAFIAGLGVADDFVPVAVSSGAESGKSGLRKVLQNMFSGLATEAKGNFNLAGDPLSQQMIDVEAEEGTSNTFYGLDAGNGTMTGASNSFFGRYAGNSNTTGDWNTFIGRAAGRLNKIGVNNTFLGVQSGNSNIKGNYNVFLGGAAGRLNEDGSANTFVGVSCGDQHTTGNHNVFIGAWAGYGNQDGIQNTFLGNYAGDGNFHGSGNVFLGFDAGNAETGSNKLYIDNSNTLAPLIYGDFNTNILRFNGKVGIDRVPAHKLHISAAYCDGGAWVDGSSREYKENIEELTSADALQAFEALEPVKFNYKENKDETYLGFIAEDVPDLVAMNDRKGLNAMDMVAMLTKVVQEQQKALLEQQKSIAELREKILKLESVSPIEK